MRPTVRMAVLATAVATLAGCGSSDGGGSRERADRPVKPPPGWRTVRNVRAGFTIAVPRSWPARTKRGATLIRSEDRLVAMTVGADRGKAGRESAPADYARETLQELPGFEGSVSTAVRPIPSVPYGTARVDGVGTVRTSRRAQRITVVAYHRPGLVTFAAIAFRNARLAVDLDEAVLRRALRTFRAGPPG
jgi:hypothetical protein